MARLSKMTENLSQDLDLNPGPTKQPTVMLGHDTVTNTPTWSMNICEKTEVQRRILPSEK